MKSKLLALTLALLMLVSSIPVGAIGMVAVETADEVSIAIPETAEEAAVMSSQDIPADAPEWAVLYEDFETKTLGDTHSSYANFTYADEDFASYKFHKYQNAATYVADPADANNKVLKITANSGTSSTISYNAGLRIDFGELPINEVGEYTISYKWYVIPQITTEDGYLSKISNQARLNKDPASDSVFYQSGYTDVKYFNTWNQYDLIFKIYERDGVKYFYINNKESAFSDIYDIVIHNESHFSGTSVGSVDWYYDDFTLSYYPSETAPTTVEYVDEAGTQLFTEAAASRKYELATKADMGISYYPAYFYNGEQINSNYFYIPSNASNVTITVKANDTIYLEDFESFISGHTFKLPKYTSSTQLNTDGTTATHYPTFRREGITSYIVSGDEVAKTDTRAASAQQWVVKTLSDGNKVLNIKGNRAEYNANGFKFYKMDLSKPGLYRLSMDLNVRIGPGTMWGDGQPAGDNQFNVAYPGGAAIVGEDDLDFTHTVMTIEATDNGDGTMTYVVYNNVNDTVKNANKNDTKYTSVAPKNQAQWVYYFHGKGEKTETGSLDMYVDNIQFTYGAPVNVNYRDKNGNVLGTVVSYQGTEHELNSANASLKYVAQYTIDGVTYDERDIYDIPADATTVNVTVSRYEMPETAPANAVIYEDFEKTSVFGTSLPAATYIDETVISTVPTFGAQGESSYSYTTFDGKSVLKNNSPTGHYPGFALKNLNLTKPGKYVYTIKYYMELPAGATYSVAENAVQVRENASNNENKGGDSTFSSDKTAGKWYASTDTFELTVTDGQLYIGKNAISKIDSFVWYTNRSDTSVNCPYNVYVDEVYLTRVVPVTVKFVDATGAELYKVESYQSATITLPAKNALGVTYNYPVFTADGLTYKAGDEITIPAKAAGEYVITVSRPEFPATAPANAILFEDFENRDTTITNAPATSISYVSYAANDSGTIGEYSVASGNNPVYAADPKNINNKVFKVTGSTRYDNGLNIKNLAINEVGKYVVSYDWYTDASLTNHPNCTCFARIYWQDANGTNQFKDMAHIATNQFNTEAYRNSWNTKQYMFEIYEENGVKHFVTGSSTSELPKGSVFGFELYMENPAATSDNTYTVYYDNVSVTVERPKNYTATFKNVYGEDFEYSTSQLSYDGYTLPTATDLGLGYEPKFTLDYEEYYYPGETVGSETDKTSFEFIVVPSNVIFKENFEDETSTTGADGTADYARGDANGGYPSGVRVAEHNGSKAYYREAQGWANNSVATGFALKTPGVYTIKYDVTLDKLSSTVKTTTVYTMLHNTWKDPTGVNTNPDATTTIKSIALTPDNSSATVEAKLELYYNADGVLAYKNTSGAEKICNVSGTVPKVVVAFDSKDESNKSLTSPVRIYIDNFTIEFEPYAPTTVKMASFREEDADNLGGPAGIRFASYVTGEQRTVAAEYGYVVTLKDYLDNGDGTYAYENLFIDNIDSVSATNTTDGTNTAGVKFVAAAAYNGTVDRIYAENGSIFDNGKITYHGIEEIFYTGVLYGITSEVQKSKVFVARPYIKINGVYYYGDCHETSYNAVYNAAKANA